MSRRDTPRGAGVGGVVVFVGAVVGLVTASMPKLSTTVRLSGTVLAGQTSNALNLWQGQVALGGLVAAALACLGFFMSSGNTTKVLGWCAFVCGVVVTVASASLFAAVLGQGGSGLPGLFDASAKSEDGLMLTAAAGVLVVLGSLLAVRRAGSGSASRS
jgi:hypothetical protein